MKSDLVEILTNNLLVPVEIEVAVTKKKGENRSMTKKSEYKIKRLHLGRIYVSKMLNYYVGCSQEFIYSF